MNFNVNEILNGLNEEQQKPVTDFYGPQIIIAGPGSGKTYTLVERTKYMILQGVNPCNILLFTFTNKAAKEIRNRISTALGAEIAKKITMGTYHSFCCRLLRSYCERLQYESNFSIFDADDSTNILKTILKDTNVETFQVKQYISLQKRKLISPEQALTNSLQEHDQFGNYYCMYQKELKQQNAMDFDDLIYNAIRILQNNPDILEEINKRYVYITADESHDSAQSDLTLIKLLAGDKQNVAFILDDCQSIYSFRGADINAVLKLPDQYPNIKIFNLNRNYRSSKTIVQASKSLIANNQQQLKKDIFTENENGDKIIIFEEEDQLSEAQMIARTINLLHDNYKMKYADIAILYRTNAQSRILEEVFLKYKIPYQILSGINFYSRKEVKDLLSFIRFIANPYDLESFTRIINIPKKGIGEKTLEKILNTSRNNMFPMNLLTACEKTELKGKAKQGVDEFIKNIKTIQERLDDLTVAELITEIIKLTNYYNFLQDTCEKESEFQDRVANVLELIEMSYSFVTLEEFLENSSLDRPEDEQEDKIQLLTMHMSKGLEWKAVFIAGAIEGTCPFFKSLQVNSLLQEERRLFYVAMTRAKEQLFISYPKRVQIAGMFRKSQPSRFIKEIDSKYLFNFKKNIKKTS